jgi:hypothetical protein
MKYEKIGENIIITIPFWSRRTNEWSTGNVGSYQTLTGLIIRHDKDGNDWDEIGFANTIDMGYKGKADQVGSFLVMWDGEEEDFLKKCKEWKIGIEELKDSDY